MRTFCSRWPTLLAVFLSIWLVGGCVGDGSPCTALPGGARYCLQPMADIVPFDVQQKVDIVFNGRQETMIAQLEADDSGMRFVGMTPFGQKLVQLDFDNHKIKVEAFPGKGPDPVMLLALVQVATWPAERVRRGLDDAVAVEDAEGLRRLVKDGKDIVVIRYTRGRPPLGDMSIQLPAAGVEFTIVNLDVADTR